MENMVFHFHFLVEVQIYFGQGDVIGDLLSAKSGVNSLKEKVCFFGGHFVLESDKKLDGVGPVDNRPSTN